VSHKAAALLKQCEVKFHCHQFAIGSYVLDGNSCKIYFIFFCFSIINRTHYLPISQLKASNCTSCHKSDHA